MKEEEPDALFLLCTDYDCSWSFDLEWVMVPFIGLLEAACSVFRPDLLK